MSYNMDEEDKRENHKRRRRSVRNIRRQSGLVPFNLNTLEEDDQKTVAEDDSSSKEYGSLWMETQELVKKKKKRRSSLFVGLSVRRPSPLRDENEMSLSYPEAEVSCDHVGNGSDKQDEGYRSQENSSREAVAMLTESHESGAGRIKTYTAADNLSKTAGLNSDICNMETTGDVLKDDSKEICDTVTETKSSNNKNVSPNSINTNLNLSLELNADLVDADTSITPHNNAKQQCSITPLSMSPDFPESPSGILFMDSHDESYVGTLANESREVAEMSRVNVAVNPNIILAHQLDVSLSDKENSVAIEKSILNVSSIDKEELTNKTSPGFLSMCKALAGKVVNFVRTSPSYLTNTLHDISNTSTNCSSPILKVSQNKCASPILKVSQNKCASPILKVSQKGNNTGSPNSLRMSAQAEVDQALLVMESDIYSNETASVDALNMVDANYQSVGIKEPVPSKNFLISASITKSSRRSDSNLSGSVKKIRDRKSFFDTFNAVSVELQKERVIESTPDAVTLDGSTGMAVVSSATKKVGNARQQLIKENSDNIRPKSYENSVTLKCTSDSFLKTKEHVCKPVSEKGRTENAQTEQPDKRFCVNVLGKDEMSSQSSDKKQGSFTDSECKRIIANTTGNSETKSGKRLNEQNIESSSQMLESHSQHSPVCSISKTSLSSDQIENTSTAENNDVITKNKMDDEKNSEETMEEATLPALNVITASQDDIISDSVSTTLEQVEGLSIGMSEVVSDNQGNEISFDDHTQEHYDFKKINHENDADILEQNDTKLIKKTEENISHVGENNDIVTVSPEGSDTFCKTKSKVRKRKSLNFVDIKQSSIIYNRFSPKTQSEAATDIRQTDTITSKKKQKMSTNVSRRRSGQLFNLPKTTVAEEEQADTCGKTIETDDSTSSVSNLTISSENTSAGTDTLEKGLYHLDLENKMNKSNQRKTDNDSGNPTRKRRWSSKAVLLPKTSSQVLNLKQELTERLVSSTMEDRNETNRTKIKSTRQKPSTSKDLATVLAYRNSSVSVSKEDTEKEICKSSDSKKKKVENSRDNESTQIGNLEAQNLAEGLSNLELGKQKLEKKMGRPKKISLMTSQNTGKTACSTDSSCLAAFEKTKQKTVKSKSEGLKSANVRKKTVATSEMNKFSLKTIKENDGQTENVNQKPKRSNLNDIATFSGAKITDKICETQQADEQNSDKSVELPTDIEVAEQEITVGNLVLPDQEVTVENLVLPEQEITVENLVLPEQEITVENLVLPEDTVVLKRRRRRSAEAATLKIKLQADGSDVDSPMKEDDWNAGPTTAIKPNRKRKLDINDSAEELEKIYKNKNYVKPEERKPWQTIYESPNGCGELFGKKRLQRFTEFEKPTQMKLRRRLQKATKNGWDPKRRKKCELKDDIVHVKLANLFSELDSEKSDCDTESLENQLKKFVETE